MAIQENNFKIRCTQDCYGLFNKLWYKKDNVYVFKNGFCIREDGNKSMEYTSFNNFIQFNSGWENCFINVSA